MLASTSLGGSGRPQQLQQADPVAEDSSYTTRSPGVDPQAGIAREPRTRELEVVGEIVGVVNPGTDDHDRRQAVGGQGGGYQPDSSMPRLRRA